MKNKKELLKNLDLKFQDIHPGGEFLKQIMERVVEKYNPNWENSIEIKISGKDSNLFISRGPEIAAATEQIFYSIGVFSKINFIEKGKLLIIDDIFIQ